MGRALFRLIACTRTVVKYYFAFAVEGVVFALRDVPGVATQLLGRE